MKTCSLCKTEKPLDEFSPCKGGRHGRHSRCKKCNAALTRESNARKKSVDLASYRQAVRRANLKSGYGLTTEGYDALLMECGGACQVCGDTPFGKPLFVDHCHITGLVRGLLCGNCNTAIGMVGERTEVLRRMIAYLDGEPSDATPAAP